MNRRELLKMIALVTGGAVVGGELFLAGYRSGGDVVPEFNEDTLALLDEIAETIIPTTSTPGAKAAKVAAFMEVFVTDCYEEADRKIFLGGVVKLNDACREMHGRPFMKASPEERKSLLIALDREARAHAQAKAATDRAHYFTLMKQATILGFFTSETGCTQTLRHVPIPGTYDGAYPYARGDRAWSE